MKSMKELVRNIPYQKGFSATIRYYTPKKKTHKKLYADRYKKVAKAKAHIEMEMLKTNYTRLVYLELDRSLS